MGSIVSVLYGAIAYRAFCGITLHAVALLSIKGNGTRTVRDFFSHCSAINIVAIAGSYGCSFSRPGGFTDGSIGPRRRALMRRIEFRQAPLEQLISWHWGTRYGARGSQED